jgi:hypothetical protein
MRLPVKGASRVKWIATALAAVAIFVSGPALAGDATAERVAAFKPGVTTYDDVVQVLGPPMSVTVSSDGSRTVVYVSTHTHVKLATFIPYVGLFAGGATASTSTTYFTFGSDGRLTLMSGSDTSMDCSSNVFSAGCKSGRPSPPAPAQTTASSGVVQSPGERRLGASFTDLPALTATMLSRPDLKAAMVVSVASGSVAERGGLKAGDSMTAFDGNVVKGQGDLTRLIVATPPGKPVSAVVLRGGQETSLTLQF